MIPFNDIEQKLYQIDRSLCKNAFEIPDISEVIPASIMVHDLVGGIPEKIIYMNKWGCHNLGVELEELNMMQVEYYEEFFIASESQEVFPKIAAYCNRGDSSQQFCFFQRVKLYNEEEHQWFYSVCKLLSRNGAEMPDKLLMLSSPLYGADVMMNKVKKVLDENQYISQNYKKFASLTRREKEIIGLLGVGKSTPQIAEILFISKETVSTHRKNIARKLEVKSFAELLRFAIAFELISD